MPKISVVITAYNAERYISEAVESILGQTFTDFELIIVNDASTDSTALIVDEYARCDSRVRLVSNSTNLGRSASSSRGLHAAQASIVARLDADDVAHPKRLDTQWEFLQSNPDIDVVGTFADEIDETGSIIGRRELPVSHDEIVKALWANPIIHPGVAFRKSAVLAVGGYEERRKYLDDYDLWFRCAASGFRFANIPSNLIKYRVTSAQKGKRRTLRWCFSQITTGWRGCYSVGSGPLAYIGVLYPVLKAQLPLKILSSIEPLAQRFDPRRRSSGVSKV